MKKGDIFLTEIPLNKKVYEQGGLRPVIIFSDEVAGIVSIIPLTANFLSLKFPFTIKTDKSEINGLKKNSVALVFQLRAIDKRRIKTKLGELEDSLLKELNTEIMRMLKIK